MHHLMHGYGYQTWEYSPAYAIRSYAYLWLYILPLRLYTNLAQANRVSVSFITTADVRTSVE